MPVPIIRVPLTRWSLSRLSIYLADHAIVEVSARHLGVLLADAGLSFQRTRTWKASPDPDYETKAARVLALCAAPPSNGVVISFDQMGPISLRPIAGAGWAPRAAPNAQRADYNRRHGTRYVFGDYDVHADRLRVRLRPRRRGSDMLALMRQIRACYPNERGSTGSRTTSRLTGWRRSAHSPPTTTSSSSRHRPTPAI